MSKIINIIGSNNNDELSPEEAKHLELSLNNARLCLLDGGDKVSFAANVEDKPWGVSYGVLVRDSVGNTIGRLESPMAIQITDGVYVLEDGSRKGIRVVAHDTDRRLGICA